MSKYFALSILATVLAAAGARALAPPAPQAPIPVMIVELPAKEAQEPAREIGSTPEIPVSVQEPTVAAAPAPVIIILEPLPILRTEVIEKTVYVPQTTVITTTTNNYFPVESAPAPKNEVVETAVIQTVFVCPSHHRAGCCVAPAPRHAPPRDTFFRTIPFMPNKPLPGIEQAIQPAPSATRGRGRDVR